MGSDPVIIHEEPWWDSLDLLSAACLILLLPQENRTAVAQDLLLAVPGARVAAFGSNPALTLLDAAGKLEMFPWLDLALKPEHILQDDLFMQAKRINLRYAHIYSGVEETGLNREAEWDKLDAFTRDSNVSCADYHDIRLEMLKLMGLPADADRLPPGKMELLVELEHIRWCRYHYLSNWRRDTSENGKKDPAARLHPDLIPYGELTKATREKDRENIRVLLGVAP